jgi:intracellular multiplication protein IcmL
VSPDVDLEQMRKEIVPKLVRSNMILTVAVVILSIAMIAIAFMAVNKKPLTFGVTDTGRIIPLIPLDQPYVGDARVIGFADECVRQAFSHDFKNFRLTLAGAKTCFTAAGARGFDAAIEPLIGDIQDKRMVMSVSMEPAVIVRVAKPRGVHTWVVQSRMTLYREGTKERVVPTTFTVDLVVERLPLEESVRGIGIAQINVRPGSAS